MKKPFIVTISCLVLSTLLFVLYTFFNKQIILWFGIGCIVVAIGVYQVTGGPRAFRSFNKKLNKRKEE